MKTFREIAENDINKNLADADEYDCSNVWNNIKKIPKKKGSYNGFDIYKVKDYYFIIKEEKYVGHINVSAEENKTIFISTGFSNIRGAYKSLLLGLLKVTTNKRIISDVFLSTPATKFWQRIIDDTSIEKVFLDYNDEIVLQSKTISNEEVKKYFEDGEFRVGIIG